MGHHHPQVNHSLWQVPHAHGLALVDVAKVKTNTATSLLCERYRGLLLDVAGSVINIGKDIRQSLQNQ